MSVARFAPEFLTIPGWHPTIHRQNGIREVDPSASLTGRPQFVSSLPLVLLYWFQALAQAYDVGGFRGDLEEGRRNLDQRMETELPTVKEGRPGRGMALLVLTCLGVVFGDIGTSPLYAFRVCFSPNFGVALAPDTILGVLSLIVWSLIAVISVKYLAFIMRAENQGEGGIMVLTGLLLPGRNLRTNRSVRLLIGLGLFGAALFFGDAMVTPAISVLSAMEGLSVVAPHLGFAVKPVAILILVGLFSIQHRGTARIGRLFGPVMLLWFTVLSVLGIRAVLATPVVMGAFNPVHAFHFLARNSLHGFLTLGAVFLVVTGGEALYADMGHFGKKPIQMAWFLLVLPALLLNYFGQGALLMRNPAAIENPFFLLAPSWAVLPLVVLSTGATIIASQAVISGSFSLARQAVQLGYSSRLVIRHTSPSHIGQIYVPSVNWALMVATIALVGAFGSSDNLAAAYGVAVTTTMVITTVLFSMVARVKWGWPTWVVGLLTAFFLMPDLAFFAANLAKVVHGGWFPLAVAAVVFTAMATWKRGREILAERLRKDLLKVESLVEELGENPPVRVPGTAIFMTGTTHGVPHALLHNLKHNHVLHERVILLTVVTEDLPKVPPPDCIEIHSLGAGIFRIIVHRGFMESPEIEGLVRLLAHHGFTIDLMKTSFFLGRENLVPTLRPGMSRWRKRLFILMSRNAVSATDFFGLPVNRVVEFGIQVEI